MALNEKTIETRFWYTDYRELVLICSAKKYDTDWRKISSRPNAPLSIAGFFQLGHALCVGKLVDCRPMERRDEDASMVRFDASAKRFSWVFEELIPVTPFAVRGRQRLFNVDESILRKEGV